MPKIPNRSTIFFDLVLPSSFIPPKDIRILCEFTRYKYKLSSLKNSEKNRFQNTFTACNVALNSVVSDMFECHYQLSGF